MNAHARPDGALPALSVVIPARDRESTIARAVDSVLSSARQDVEVIVVDDGSTDRTLAILAGMSDPRLRVHALPVAGGANRARNIGAEMARGDLVAFLDSDDAFGPERVERLIAFFAARPDVDCTIDGFVEHSRRRSRRHELPAAAPDRARLRRMLLAHSLPLTNSTLTVRRAVFEEVGGYDETLRRHQDRELLLRLADRYRVEFGGAHDVAKYRAGVSISHTFRGYMAGLDGLAALAADYQRPEYSDIFAYLAVRGFLKPLLQGAIPTAFAELRVWMRSQHLPRDVVGSFARYFAGKRQRRFAGSRDDAAFSAALLRMAAARQAEPAWPAEPSRAGEAR